MIITMLGSSATASGIIAECGDGRQTLATLCSLLPMRSTCSDTLCSLFPRRSTCSDTAVVCL